MKYNELNFSGNIEVVELLIKNGADVNMANDYEETALQIADKNGNSWLLVRHNFGLHINSFIYLFRLYAYCKFIKDKWSV